MSGAFDGFAGSASSVGSSKVVFEAGLNENNEEMIRVGFPLPASLGTFLRWLVENFLELLVSLNESSHDVSSLLGFVFVLPGGNFPETKAGRVSS